MSPSRRSAAASIALLLPLALAAAGHAEVRLEPRIVTDQDRVTAILVDEWRDSCVPRLRSVERDPTALFETPFGRITVRLDAQPIGGCLSAVTAYTLEIPLGILPGGRWALDVLVEDPIVAPGQELFLDGTSFDVSSSATRERLPLLGGRFVATAERAAGDAFTPAGVAAPRTPESGQFWFFEPGNWEINLKLLDACAINDHYWLLAAATTDVPWRLEVADRITGDRFGVEHAGGAPSPATIDVEAFACDDTEGCGTGVVEDILASPRPDPDAERLAILLDGTVAAGPDTYERLARDLAEIRRLRPETRAVALTPPFRLDALTLVLSPAGVAELAEDGELADARCLDTRYGVRSALPVNGGEALLLGFEALLDMRSVALDYAALGSVDSALLATEPLPQGPSQVCVDRQGDRWLYFLRALSPTAPAPWFHFTSTSGFGAEEVGAFAPGDPEPEWLEDARDCLLELGLE